MQTTPSKNQHTRPTAKKQKTSKERKTAVALLSAAVGRLGGQSPAAGFASDPMLCKFFFEEWVAPRVTRILVLGGTPGTHCTEVYDVQAAFWAPAPPIPVHPRSYHGAALVCGRVYVVAGDDLKCFAFDLASSVWVDAPALSAMRLRAGVAAVGGDRVVVMGGSVGGVCCCTCEQLLVTRNGAKWTGDVVPPMPTAKSDFGVAVVGSRVITLGGWTGKHVLSNVEVLETETNKWGTMAPMPTARQGMAVAVVQDRVWVMGGHDGQKILDVIEVLDVKRNLWISAEARMTTPRYAARAVTANGIVHVIGGEIAHEATHMVEIFDPSTGQWDIAPVLSTPRMHLDAVAF